MLAPARYAPWSKGVYEVSPNLRPFGTDFGNRELDQKVFQIDADLPLYVASKRAALGENPSKYVARHDLSEDVEQAVLDFMVGRLCSEWPDHFPKIEGVGLNEIGPLFQEDFAIVVRKDSKDWIAHVNVCNPSHWKPTDKIGLSFFDSHTPIPGFDRVNAVAGAMVNSMINKGPFVRFVWGLESDDRLNHHPIAPPGVDQKIWYGREFEKGLFVRTERQVIWPFPELDAALFMIRPIVYSAESVQKDPASWDLLVRAVRSMSAEAREYKGIPEGIL